MHTRDRLLRDPSAGEALLRWAMRHDDLFAEAIALAHLGADPERWTRFDFLVHALDDEQLAVLDTALTGWPDHARIAHDDWASRTRQRPPEIAAAMRLARALRWPDAGVKSEDIEALFDAEAARSLTILDLRYNIIGAQGARVIADPERGPRQPTLLNLRYNRLGDEGLRALATSESMRGLNILSLQRNGIGPEGARALAESPYIQKLTSLDLRHNPIGEEGAKALAGSANLRGLTTLRLSLEDVTMGGAFALGCSPHLSPTVARYWRALSW